MADFRSPDRRIVDGIREFYLGYLSTYLPNKAFDRVRRQTVTDAAIRALNDVRAEVDANGVAPAATGFTDQQMCDAVPETATLLEPLQGPGKVCMTRQELRAFAEGLMRSLGVEGKTNG